MNIPMPTYRVVIVVNGKLISIGTYTSISHPTEAEIKKMALEKGYSEFTDSNYIMINDGRDT